MNNVILICGKAGSGKNKLAELIKNHLDTEPSGRILDKTLIRGNAQSVKDVATKEHNWNGEKDVKGRQLLIDITNEGYATDKFYWEDQTFTEAIMHKEFVNKYCDYLIIPDWRYACTPEYFRERFDKVVTVRIERPNLDKGTHDTHSSENDFMNFEVDYEVFNTRDIAQLDKIAKRIATKIKG